MSKKESNANENNKEIIRDKSDLNFTIFDIGNPKLIQENAFGKQFRDKCQVLENDEESRIFA